MSRVHLVQVPPPKKLIQPSSWRSKKLLADCHLDLAAICEHGCRYCSTNNGLLYQFRKQSWGDAIEEQLGKRVSPDDDPYLHLIYPDVVARLERELRGHRRGYGRGRTLVVSQHTDALAPYLVKEGTTRSALELVLRYTEFRIRILTKSAVVGHAEWIEFFGQHPGRFVVGLSTGSLDDEWARDVEIATSQPSARLRAHRALQDAGVPVFGMLCPVFPDAAARIHELVDGIRPEKCEHVWAEPYNDRSNWEIVRSGYTVGSPQYEWFTSVFERGNVEAWSEYATKLYVELRIRALAEGWIDKLRFMLYEGDEHFGVVAEHKRSYCDLRGLLLQNVGKEGKSSNPHIEEMRSLITGPTAYDYVRSDYSLLDEDDCGDGEVKS